MSNILLDANGDLDLTSGFQIVSGSNAVAQRLRNAFEFFLGEWFLDTREGIPYLQVIFKKGTELGIVSQIFRAVILRDPEIVTVIDFNMDFNRITRKLIVTFVGRLIDGGTVSLDPLVIDLSKLVK